MVMGGGISAYRRKYPSTSWTSERHIPHALTFTRISSGWMSGIGISSRTTGLLYSWMRAAFMEGLRSCLRRLCCRPRWIDAEGRMAPHTLRLCVWGVVERRDGGLGNSNILFDRAGARSDSADDAAGDPDRHAATEDYDLAAVALFNPE